MLSKLFRCKISTLEFREAIYDNDLTKVQQYLAQFTKEGEAASKINNNSHLSMEGGPEEKAAEGGHRFHLTNYSPALIIAASQGHVQIVEELINRGANPRIECIGFNRHRSYETAFLAAMNLQDPQKITLLLTKGTPVSAKDFFSKEERNLLGATPGKT